MWPANAVQALTAETTEDCRRQPQVSRGVRNALRIAAHESTAETTEDCRRQPQVNPGGVELPHPHDPRPSEPRFEPSVGAEAGKCGPRMRSRR